MNIVYIDLAERPDVKYVVFGDIMAINTAYKP